MQTLTVRTEV